MEERWLLLLYTVPSEPARKRAFIWRHLKQIGAVYLRDGVCALPQRPEAAAALREIMAKVQEFEGEATLVEQAHLDEPSAAGVVDRSRTARVAEYQEIAREAQNFLDHVRRETDHREFRSPELELLGTDLAKLRRWEAQIHERDYFDSEGSEQVSALLDQCDDALGGFLEQTFTKEPVQ